MEPIGRRRCIQALSQALAKRISADCCHVELITTATVELLSPLDFLDRCRAEGAEMVVRKYVANRLGCYIPVWDGEPHLGVLAERTSAGLMVIDGTHRVRAAAAARISELRVFVYSMGNAPPPCELRPAGALPLADRATTSGKGDLVRGDGPAAWRDGAGTIALAATILKNQRAGR